MPIPTFIRTDVTKNDGTVRRFYINLDSVDYFTTDLIDSELELRIYIRHQEIDDAIVLRGKAAETFKLRFAAYTVRENKIQLCASGQNVETQKGEM